jgi:phage-related protein
MEIQTYKNNHLEKLQNLHRETTHKSIDGLFDQNPHKRSYTAKKFDVSLPDFAEIPKRTPDEKLIRMIASEMNKRNEKSMTPVERENYFNDYLISYKNKD